LVQETESAMATTAEAERVLQRLEATAAQWQEWPSAGRFAEQLTRARAAVAAARRLGASRDTIGQPEEQLAAAPRGPAVSLSAYDRASGLLEPATGADPKVLADVRVCNDRIAAGCLAALRDSLAAGQGDAGAQRSAVEKAEAIAAELLARAEKAR